LYLIHRPSLPRVLSFLDKSQHLVREW